MSRFGGRLAVLERQLGGEGCAVCGAGKPGPVAFRMRERGDPPSPPCPACGRVPVVFTLHLGDPEAEQRVAAALARSAEAGQ